MSEVPIAHEVFASGGVDYHGGARQVAVGVGPTVGYRLHARPWLHAYAKAGPRVYGGRAAVVDLGASWVIRGPASYRPGLGLELATSWGERIRVVTDQDPIPPRGPAAVAVRLVARPLVFGREAWTVSTLGLAYGRGLEDLATTHAIGVDLLEVGWTAPIRAR